LTTLATLDGEAEYKFNIASSGTYDVAVRILFPFWDKNSINISLNGVSKNFTENRLWWPYWRTTCWLSLSSSVFLSAGTHTVSITTGVPGVLFYGFRVCSNFKEQPSAGEAEFTLSPRKFKDVTGVMAEPDRGFRLTTEVLRRKPDSALVWYEDFRDPNPLLPSYWKTLSGDWSVWKNPNDTSNRPYSQLDGYGQLAWNYTNFSDIHLRARIAFTEESSSKAGIFCGDVFCCLNYDTQRIELYKGSSLLASYNTEIGRTPTSELRSNPRMYTIEMRIRGNRVRVYSGASNILRFTSNLSGFTGGYAGICSDGRILSELLRMGDSWIYEPYERFDVVFPDGSKTEYGRLNRTGVTLDNEFQVFAVNSDVEESATRSDDISMDYDFFHSELLPLSCGNDYTVKIIPKDINIWLSRLFLGDADGFSILYYQDVDSLVYWSNEAAYRWKLKGIAIWSLGQEDMRIWEALPKQI
jgi:hypothetical protein